MQQVSVTFIGWTTSQVIHPLGLGDMTTNHSMYWQTTGISGSMSTCREHLLPDGGSVTSLFLILENSSVAPFPVSMDTSAIKYR